jgi:ubiquinone/menaquinone biosynthesis C-methylase UbiE
MIYKYVPQPFKKAYQKLYYKLFYNLLTFFNHIESGGFVKFMNYGYAGSEEINEEVTIEYVEKLQSQLYLFLMKHAPINGKDIIEIGCGRGGGCSLLQSHFNPRSVVGIDLSVLNIRKCRKNFKGQNIDFRQGDAEKQLFPDSSFDVVINLESSHCYPSKQSFLRNVHSILRQEGYFLYADVFRSDKIIDETEKLLKGTGFIISQKEDITQNVVNSLKIFAGKRDEIIKKYRMLSWFKINEKFIASDSNNFIKFLSGEKKYIFYLVRKSPLND